MVDCLPGLERLLDHLERGGVVAFPTDTVPALAARPPHGTHLWQLKRRPADKPLILMGHSQELLFSALGSAPLTPWQEQAGRCWPGAVTLVLPAAEGVAEQLNPHAPHSLGLRIPAAAAALALLRRSGPLATTSANHSGRPALLDPASIAAVFPEVCVWSELGWPRSAGLASTVLAWQGGGWRCLRRGAVDPLSLC
ncbi:MAG: Sua5/YciO/YrdC/YwlC family protein [Aphanocapsa feldmannii 277cV]|uniref:L-threonylcarbamoyladenylate synthase n=2 Tax=Aphanocapsa feldmannii TaxID=192050 RepID=A0A524RMM4_9CHRO|nr:MAG: Sua5/YciO/YrdC/YwlC family protein [Aphanocapsa feldmannii 277cV]TGH20348.1 MAG: Sua5/YciO/YrdC/YwlC family protein [Aphanocapsa feldmannii 277cI]